MLAKLRCLLVCAGWLMSGGLSQAQESVFVTPAGNVGVGTDSPEAALTVLRDDGTAWLLVDEESSLAAARTLLTLRNNGGVRITMANGPAGTMWQLSGLANFNINFSGHAGNELQLEQDGDLLITGALSQGSSRTVKRDIVDADGGAILERLTHLPISTWRYRNDATGALHIGPVAEDFHAAFGFGADKRHVAPSDEAGVALVAVKALTAVVEDLRREVLELRETSRAVPEGGGCTR